MGRRYEELDEDANDDTIYQAAPRGKKPRASQGRYEQTRMSLQAQQSSRRAKFYQVYTSGEKYIYDKPIKITFSRKKMPVMSALLDEISKAKERINSSKTLVKYLFKWPSGEVVDDIAQLEYDDETNILVCSENTRLYKRNYGEMESGGGTAFTEKYSRNSHDSRGSLKQSPTSVRSVGSNKGPINVNVISNLKRENKQSLFLDPSSRQPFEEILRNVTEMLKMDSPCRALYSVKPPHKKVESISSLNRVVPMYGDTFWACGQEEPIKSSSKSRDTSPIRNGHGAQQRGRGGKQQNGYGEEQSRRSNGHVRQSNGYEDSKGREYQKHQAHGQSNGYDSGEDESPTRRDYKDRSPQRKADPRDARDSRGNHNQTQASRNASRVEQKRNGRNDQDDRYDRDAGDGHDDSDDDNRRGSRGNTPSEEEMRKRINDMENTKDDMDDKIEY